MSRRPPDDADADADLAALLADLSTTLEELQATVEDADRDRGRRRRARRDDRSDDRRGPPRPPRPRTALRYAEREAIPTLIAFLEANVRALESLRALIRLVDGAEELDDRAAGRDPDPGTVQRVGERTVNRLDRVLADFQDAVEGDSPNPEARELLAEARALGEEIDARVREASGTGRPDGSGAVRIGVADAGGSAGPEDGAERGDEAETDATEGGDETGADAVDVDAELDSLRRRVRGDEREGPNADADADTATDADANANDDSSDGDDGA